jgi:hypothetical protein
LDQHASDCDIRLDIRRAIFRGKCAQRSRLLPPRWNAPLHRRDHSRLAKPNCAACSLPIFPAPMDGLGLQSMDWHSIARLHAGSERERLPRAFKFATHLHRADARRASSRPSRNRSLNIS